MGKGAGCVVAIGVFWSASQALAGPAFTAEAVHMVPGQPTETGRVFVSEQGSRFEFERQGRAVIQIALPGQGIVRTVFPADKTYVEITQPPRTAENPATPCPPPTVARCERTGTETLNERPVEIWKITLNPLPGQPLPGQNASTGFLRIWWDAERKLALREQYPDGGTSTTVLRGRVDYEGRSVEHWQMTITSSEGKTMRMAHWHDPELQTDVREEHANGAVRAFRNIRMVAPDPAWFAVPAGYRRIDPQAAYRGPQEPSSKGVPSGKAPAETPGGYPPAEP